MTEILLDIGAGDKSFAQAYRKHNPGADLMYLCAEPFFTDPRKKDAYISSPRRGKIYKVRGEYENFQVPDHSLAAVTLNAYHILSPPGRIEQELTRCLKPGGFFFSAHPIGAHPRLDETEFIPVIFTRHVERDDAYHTHVSFQRCGKRCYVARLTIGEPTHDPEVVAARKTIHYPASPVILDRLLHGMERRSIRYVYSGDPTPPSLRVWQRKD